jgi:uncharacterized YigZ family protein
MIHQYLTIETAQAHEIEINKSRFIAAISFADNESDAISFLQSIRTRHPDATHNCYAWVLGRDRQTRKFSDDGEPGGTAGQPIFHVLDKNQLTNIVIVVTRYFGGTKLGAGGLVRAYTKATSSLIEQCDVSTYSLHHTLRYTFDYHYLGSIQNYLETHRIKVLETTYADAVSIVVALPLNQSIQKIIAGFTSGTAQEASLNTVYLSI